MDLELMSLYPYNVANDLKWEFISQVSGYAGPQYCLAYVEYSGVKLTCVNWVHFINLLFLITFLWALLCLFRALKL